MLLFGVVFGLFQVLLTKVNSMFFLLCVLVCEMNFKKMLLNRFQNWIVFISSKHVYLTLELWKKVTL